MSRVKISKSIVFYPIFQTTATRTAGYISKRFNEIEKELNRVQSDIDSMQGRMDFLKSKVEFAELDVYFHRKPILGPLGYVFKGVWWGIEKMFIIRR